MKREDIQAAYEAGPEAVVALVERLMAAHQTQMAELTVRIEGLEARLKQDSHNSHKPPSSDGPAILPPRRSRRKRSGKKSGGQVGHPGVTLTQTEHPDTVVAHRASICPQCQVSLASAAPVGRERRQVVDLPPTRSQVTEHQALQLCCPQCQTVTVGQFPADVTQPVQYGAGVKALAVYLQEYQHIPFERTQEFFRDAFNLAVSEGTLARARETCAARLEGVETAIKQALIQAPVVNFDETGLRIDGQTHWLHSAGTPDWTYYAVHPKRGHPAMVLASDVIEGARPR